MKKSWALLDKIREGKKIAESRWYMTKRAPWDKISKGDTIYFKDSGEPVTLKAKVTKVLQFDGLDSGITKSILTKHAEDDLGTSDIRQEIKEYVKRKRYCIIIYFNNVKEIKPFKIRKKGFGLMSAWITLDNINQIKLS